LRQFLPGFLAAHPRLPMRKKRLLARLALCRSGTLGATVLRCSGCGHLRSIPLGCGDRHCPCCQAAHSRQWLDNQLRWLLPVPYYHVVFTLPHELHGLLLFNQAALYRLLFDCASGTLLEFARNRLGGVPGITAILHTWGQQLTYHPHLHCIITAGALSDDAQTWTAPRQRGYLFPEAAVAALFRGKFLAGLRALGASLRLPEPAAHPSWDALYKKHWHVYLKRPFGGPQQALAYLAHYTHRVAISNSRFQSVNADAVRFTYRDYADARSIKSRELSGVAFIERFCLHILPARFTKIRHFGILANNRKTTAIPQVRLLLHSKKTVDLLLQLRKQQQLAAATKPPPPCPCCSAGQMLPFCVITPRGARLCRWRSFHDTS
jgi:Putative transposase/Transposase zinc-binding domain